MPTYATPISVLRAIASVCSCSLNEIEDTLECVNDKAGFVVRPITRKMIAEERLDEIRRWLGTPEGAGVIEHASKFMQQNTAETGVC